LKKYTAENHPITVLNIAKTERKLTSNEN